MAKSKGKMILILPVLLILIGGGVFGAAKMGMIKIPGITPKKLVGMYGNSKMYGDTKDPKLATDTKPKEAPAPKPKPKPIAKKPKPTVRIDPALGEEAVAELWSSMDPPKVVAILGDWDDTSAAKVLRNMDAKKSAAILTLLDTKRASKITKQIQIQSSRVALN